MNKEELLTKSFLDAKLDSSFAKQRSHLEKCFNRSNALIDVHFDAVKSKLRHNHRVWLTMQSITIIAAVYPYIERFMAL